jgi:uncharacterized protein (TIGR02611 family)
MAPKPAEVFHFLLRSSKRIAVTVVGGAFVLIGLAMLVLPGPGILVVALGFAILGTEYVWAATALEHTKRAAATAGRVARDGAVSAGRVARDGAAKATRGATGAAGSARRRLWRR